ncbi:MAG: hypothetical protein JWQ09_3839 [Segetibacter sp.]|nr:hypothetical protein [Segetibacter sp.]
MALNILITGITPIAGTSDFALLFNVNQQPNNGHSYASARDDVQWTVTTNDVKYIEDIKWKQISGSTDVFSSHPPTPTNPQRRVWKAKVNENEIYSVYVYSIKWVKALETTPRTFDPIISIKPSGLHFIAKLITGFLALFSICLLFSNKKKSSK